MKKFHGFRGPEIILSNENRSLKKKIEDLQKENRELLKKIEILQWIVAFVFGFIMFVITEAILFN